MRAGVETIHGKIVANTNCDCFIRNFSSIFVVVVSLKVIIEWGRSRRDTWNVDNNYCTTAFVGCYYNDKMSCVRYVLHWPFVQHATMFQHQRGTMDEMNRKHTQKQLTNKLKIIEIIFRESVKSRWKSAFEIELNISLWCTIEIGH